jgi:hypothetical protein
MTRWVKKGQSVLLKYTNTSTKNSCLSSDANAARITPYDFGPDPRVMTHYRVEFKLYCGTRGEAFGNGPDTQLYFVDKAPRYDYMLSANDVMDIAQQFRTDARYRAKVCNLATMVETVDKIFDYVGLGKALGEGLLKATQEFAKMKGIDLLKEPAAGSTDNCEGARRLAAAAAATQIQYGAMLSGNIGYIYAHDTYSSDGNLDRYKFALDNPARLTAEARMQLLDMATPIGRNGLSWLFSDAGPSGMTYTRGVVARYNHWGTWSVSSPRPAGGAAPVSSPTPGGSVSAPPPAPPDTPANFRVTSRSTSSITLAWTAARGARSYLVFDVASGRRVADTTATSATIPGLASNTTYRFVVQSVSDVGVSAPSSPIVAMTLPTYTWAFVAQV